MSYKIERLKKLNEFLIPQAFKEAQEHKGEEYYYRKVVDLCKERDALQRGGLSGLLAKMRRFDRFAIAIPLALTLNGCATPQDKEYMKQLPKEFYESVWGKGGQ